MTNLSILCTQQHLLLELTDKAKLEELYDGLELNSTHFLGNALNMTVFGTNYAFSKLREKVRQSTYSIAVFIDNPPK